MRVLVALGTHGDYEDGGNSRPGRDRLRALAGTSNRAIPEARALGIELGLLEQTGKARRRGGEVPIFNLLHPAEIPVDVADVLGYRDPEDEPCTDPAPTLHQTTLHRAPNDPAPRTVMVVHDPGTQGPGRKRRPAGAGQAPAQTDSTALATKVADAIGTHYSLATFDAILACYEVAGFPPGTAEQWRDAEPGESLTHIIEHLVGIPIDQVLADRMLEVIKEARA
ncbi:MAG: hypothetical protein KDB37_11140 [Ilumatobacter sp.]|nr:hypothetical protein [Ilumatobacter sp.]